jgi:threonine synthase
MAALCLRRGVREVFLDSSGNAGIAVAAACARRGIRCTVLLPATTPEVKREAIAEAGATVEVIDGDRAATSAAAPALRASGARGTYASHIYQPSFLAGVATLAWDRRCEFGVASGEDWYLPAGNGALLLGVEMGLRALAAGDESPSVRLHAVQLEGYAALHPSGSGPRPEGPPVATGIAIAAPARREAMARAVRATGGQVLRVTEGQIAHARTTLATAGYPTDPTGATAWAGLQAAREAAEEANTAPPTRRTVVILTSRAT